MLFDWSVHAQTAAGPCIRKGAHEVSADRGPLHATVTLPKCSLRQVSGKMGLTVTEEEKIFINGYQTWTYCPEHTKKDRLPGLNGVPKALLRKYGFDRYGDYFFVNYPNKPGITHGFSYCYFRRGGHYRLIGSLDERPGYTLFEYDAKHGVLTITRDCAGVEAEGAFPAFDLFFAEGDENDVFDRWFAAMGIAPHAAPPIAGYSSWYNRFQAISEPLIRQDLEGCTTILQPGDLFQIDDGWEPFVGDWLETDPVKFPNGLKPLADDIHAAGFKAGLWLAPFVAQKDSQLAKQHPDWLLQVDGRPWDLGSNWGGFCSLDIDHPGVQQYLTEVFDRVLHQWGFDLVKLDFLYGAAPFGNARESRAARMTRAMDWLRQLCKDKLILGCGVPVWPAFGRVDYCRISCDVSLDWDDKWYMRLFHQERVSTKHAMGNSIFRRQLNGRAHGNDPDVFFLREENLKLTEAQKLALAKAEALLGDVFLTSDDPTRYTDKMRAQYKEIRRLCNATDIRVDADGIPSEKLPRGVRIFYTLDGKRQQLLIP